MNTCTSQIRPLNLLHHDISVLELPCAPSAPPLISLPTLLTNTSRLTSNFTLPYPTIPPSLITLKQTPERQRAQHCATPAHLRSTRHRSIAPSFDAAICTSGLCSAAQRNATPPSQRSCTSPLLQSPCLRSELCTARCFVLCMCGIRAV